MSDDAREVVIRISAKNLTAEEFEKARKGLGGIKTAADDSSARTATFAESMRGAGRQSDSATSSFGKVEKSLRQFDDVLELAGGPHVRDLIQGVGQLDDVATGAAGNLSGLAKAGLAASAALGGWQIGRMLADLTGSDKAIGNFTAKLLGWGDVAGQQAAAAADTLARASQNAGREITDLSEAVRINEAAAKAHSQAIIQAKGPEIVAARIAEWRKEIDNLRSKGSLDGLKRDVEDGTLSQGELAKAYGISDGALKLLTGEIKKSEGAYKEATRAADAHAKGIQAIVDKLSGAGAIKSAKDYVQALGTLPPMSMLTRDAQIEIAEAMEEASAVYRAAGRTVPAAWHAIALGARAASNTLRESLREDVTATNKYLADVGKQIAAIPHGVNLRLDSRDLSAAVPLIGGVKTSWADMVDANNRSWASQGMKTRAELERTAQEARAKYELIRDSGQFTADQVQAAWERAQQANADATGGFAADFEERMRGLPSLVVKALAGGGGLAGALKGFASQIGADFGTRIFGPEGVLKGIGAAIPGIGPAIGSLLGSVISKIGGLFKSPEYKNVMKDVGRSMGVDISEGLAKQIAELEKTISGGTKDQRRKIAEALSLDKIIEEAGGVTSATVDKYAGQALNLFAIIEKGGKTGQQAVSTLGKVFTELAETAAPAGQIADAALLQIVRRAQDGGVEVKEISAFIDAHLKGAADSLNAYAAASFGSASTFTKQLATASAQATGAQKSDLDALKLAYQDDFTDIGVFTHATFAAMQANGASYRDIVKAIGPELDVMAAAQKQVGFEGDATFLKLLRFKDLTTTNQALFDQIDSLNGLMVGLGNAVGVDQTAFDAFGRQAVKQMEALVAAGGTGDEALQALAPSIQSLIELQDRFGFQVGEGTQALIDQAREAGVAGDKHKSAAERTVDMLGKVVDRMDLLLKRFGVDFPEAVEKGAKAVERGAIAMGDNITDVVKKFPKVIDIEVRGRYSGAGSEADEGGEPPAYATGGIAYGQQVARIGERGKKEIVGDVDFMSNALAGALLRMNGGGDRGAGGVVGTSPLNVYVAVDPQTGKARLMGDAERRQIQSWLSVGALQVPTRSLSERTR